MSSKLRRSFITLSIAGFFAILSSTMSKSPTLPLLAESLGISPAAIGFIASTSTIVGIFVNVIAGILSDRYGRRILLIAGGTVFATAPLLYLFVENPFQLAAVRAYHGFATAIFVPVSLALIADIFPDRKGEVMGLFSSSMTAGRMIAPTLAGTLIFTYGFKETFETCWLAGAIAFLVILLFIKPKTAPDRESSKGLALLNSRVLVVGSFEAAVYFVMQAIETFLPIYAGMIGISASEIGLLFTFQILVMAILKPIVGRISDRVGRFYPLIFGMAMSSLGVIGLSFSGEVNTIALSMVLLSAGTASVTSSTKPLASEIVSSKEHGTAIGTTETIKDVGQALGPLIIGVIIKFAGYRKAFVFLTSLPLVFIFIYLKVKGELEQQTRGARL